MHDKTFPTEFPSIMLWCNYSFVSINDDSI